MSTRCFKIDDPENPQAELVRAHFEAHGWIETEGEDWDLFWSDDVLEPEEFPNLSESKRFNQFPGAHCLGHKDELHKTLSRAADRFGREGVYDFFPHSYCMPDDYKAWRRAVAADPAQVWIQKPKWMSMGEGIDVVTDIDQVPNEEDWMVQHYIGNPLLLPAEPYKHTLRIWVALSSLDPLRVHIYSSGLARFTSRPYTSERSKLGDRVIHLTNRGVQKTNPDADLIRAIDLHAYRRELREADHDDEVLWGQIRRVIALTFFAAREPMLQEARRLTAFPENCFQLFGCDILVDDALRPWLIECNMGPSLEMHYAPGTAERRTEHSTKAGMIDRLAALVGVTPPILETVDDFEVLFPARDTMSWSNCLGLARPADLALSPALPEPVVRVGAGESAVPSTVVDDHLVLSAAGGPIELNAAASYVWLRLESGARPQQIAEEVAAMHPDAPHAGRDVWDCCGAFVEQGLITLDHEAPGKAPDSLVV